MFASVCLIGGKGIEELDEKGLPTHPPHAPLLLPAARFTGATDLFIIGSLHHGLGLTLLALVHPLIAPPPPQTHMSSAEAKVKKKKFVGKIID